MELVGREGGEGAVGGGAELEGALGAVVGEREAPRISASSPAAWRRRASICQRRSCAVTKPWARMRSSSEAAWMWGMPWVSRWMVTGAERPGMVTEPSSCGRSVVHGVVDPEAGVDEADGDERGRRRVKRMVRQYEEDAAACCLEGDLLRGEGFVWNTSALVEMGKTHGFIASVNGGEERVRAVCGVRSR